MIPIVKSRNLELRKTTKISCSDSSRLNENDTHFSKPLMPGGNKRLEPRLEPSSWPFYDFDKMARDLLIYTS